MTYRTAGYAIMACGTALGQASSPSLPQVSSKMSDAFLAIGFCCVAGVAILGEHVIFRTEGFGDIEFAANWLSRFYPVILFFLYIIMRPWGCCQWLTSGACVPE